MYRIISPSRYGEVTSRTYCNNGRGVSERRWRSAANRPSRQARRGWETEKTSQMKQACRVQQKFNSPKILPPPQQAPQHLLPTKNLSPLPPESDTGQSRANLGQNRAISGRFWAFPGQNRAVLGLLPPSRVPSSVPGNVQKLHLPARAYKHDPSTSISKIYTKQHLIITNNSKFTPLSL